MIKKIYDLTDFVKLQRKIIDQKDIEKLEVPKESIYLPKNDNIKKQIGLV